MSFRGLLLPKTVVEDYGGVRTDPGLLGHAIYFADAIRSAMSVRPTSVTLSVAPGDDCFYFLTSCGEKLMCVFFCLQYKSTVQLRQ